MGSGDGRGRDGGSVADQNNGDKVGRGEKRGNFEDIATSGSIACQDDIDNEGHDDVVGKGRGRGASFDHIKHRGLSSMAGGLEGGGGSGRMLCNLDAGNAGFDSSRWQRCVALPDSDVCSNGQGRSCSGASGQGGGLSGHDYEANDPNNLWDDPAAPSLYQAARNFTAFGGLLEDDRPSASEANDPKKPSLVCLWLELGGGGHQQTRGSTYDLLMS